MNVAIGSDHGGFLLKEEIMERLQKQVQVTDCGCFSSEPIHYPEIASKVAALVLHKKCDCGILLCGTGIGMSIAANKIPGIRAAHCADTYSARMAKEHNNANIIALGARTLGNEYAWGIIQAYLRSGFLGGVHQERLTLIENIEKEYMGEKA